MMEKIGYLKEKIYIPNNPKYLGKCGVTDYTDRLVFRLRHAGVSIRQPLLRDFSCAASCFSDDTLLHLQYPSLDYRFSLIPHIYSRLSRNCIITLHETDALHQLKKFFFPIFKPDIFIVTNEFDFSCASRVFLKQGLKKFR